ncbi:hypothetical protein [Archaeoglobus neptunius]|uniref:hypothetical protein n=1 Tax=Archaeoglobus neptunius TaxID=2798580 RepID=UPI0019270A39|nr:hypothetical protein [Archaeoglobus neptunius]
MKRHIHTTLNPGVHSMLVRAARERGKNLNEIIEEAIEFYLGSNSKNPDEIEMLRSEVFKVMDLCVISKEQLRAIVEEGMESSIRNNANELAVEWITSKPLDRVTLEEAIEAIRKIWLVCDRAREVEVVEDEGGISIFFFSKMASLKVDEMWGRQLKHFFEKRYGMDVLLELRSQGFVLKILK